MAAGGTSRLPLRERPRRPADPLHRGNAYTDLGWTKVRVDRLAEGIKDLSQAMEAYDWIGPLTARQGLCPASRWPTVSSASSSRRYPDAVEQARDEYADLRQGL